MSFYSTVQPLRDAQSTLRTTGVATLLEGARANNASPQHAQADVNCRIFPGCPIDEIAGRLAAAIGDSRVKITPLPPIRPLAKAPPLNSRAMSPPSSWLPDTCPACR